MGTYAKDFLERVTASYGLAFVGLLLANGFDFTDLTAVKAAGLAAVPAGLQVVYSALALFVVGAHRAASFPPAALGDGEAASMAR